MDIRFSARATAIGSWTLALRQSALDVGLAFAASAQGSFSVTVRHGIRVTGQRLNLGAPLNVGSTFVLWRPPSERLIAPALVEGGGSAYLRWLRLDTDGEIDVWVESSDSGFGTSTGPRLTSAWEQYNPALVFTLAGANYAIPGPFAGGGGDTSEPYDWTESAVATFVNAFLAASTADRNAVTLRLDDGLYDPGAIGLAFAAGAVGAWALSLRSPVDIGLGVAATAHGSWFLGVQLVESGETLDLGLAFDASIAGSFSLTFGRPRDVGLSFAAAASTIWTPALQVRAFDVAPRFTGSAHGIWRLSIELAETGETLSVGLAIAASASATFALSLDVTEASEILAFGLAFEAAATASLAISIRRVVPERPAPLVHWLAEFPTSTPIYRFWSGDEDLTLAGKTYQGRNFISLSGAEASLDAPNRRMTASFAVVTPELRQALMQDPGPLTVVIEWIHSTDHGQTWMRVPRKFVGRLSRPVIKDGVYTIEIETYGGDVDRGRPLKWWHEDQQARHPGDFGLSYMRQLSEGIADARWPP